METREPRYRVKIKVLKVGPGDYLTDVGERWVEMSEELTEVLGPLPDDREIMEEMKDKDPLAFRLHRQYVEQKENRKNVMKHVTDLILDQVKYIFKSQDKINGYPQEESHGSE